ncbi:hypothetical protein ACFWNQ_34535 [Streptomyces virginiae]|uniref:hypothetical protein n=1 Tax=Streptomyces virginiae TaxID=1961 RepID=UPI00365E04A8
MSAGIAPEGSPPGVDGLCEDIRGALAESVPGMLGVHVHRSVSGLAEVARLVGAVADAAEVTVLPGDGPIARAELHAAAAKAGAKRVMAGHRPDPAVVWLARRR